MEHRKDEEELINVEDYIPMVHKTTHKQYMKFKYRYSYDDMFQAGCVGLMRAAKNFNESKGRKFSTYAYKYVEGHIINLARNDSWYVANRVRDRTKESYAPVSLDQLVGYQEDTPMVDLIMGDVSEYSNLDLRMALGKLPGILKKIIEMRYFYDFTWKEISKSINMPQSTLYKYKKEALETLRKEMMA